MQHLLGPFCDPTGIDVRVVAPHHEIEFHDFAEVTAGHPTGGKGVGLPARAPG